MRSITDRLTHLANILRETGETTLAERVNAALARSDAEIDTFLESNDLWGGAGSIADQAGMSDGTRTVERRKIERALIDLGEEQVRINKLNPRTLMWIEAFGKWAQDRI
jgi:hypothetical protein